MKDQMWTFGEIEVEMWGCFTTHHLLQTETGILGEMTLPAFSSGGVFEATDGRNLVVEKTSWWRGWHELRENGVVVGTARPRGFWRRSMDVGFRGRTYELLPADFWSRAWVLVDEMGQDVLAVEPRGIFRRGAYVSILGTVHPDLVVFAYYLVNVRWQEQSAAAATSASAATGS